VIGHLYKGIIKFYAHIHPMQAYTNEEMEGMLQIAFIGIQTLLVDKNGAFSPRPNNHNEYAFTVTIGAATNSWVY